MLLKTYECRRINVEQTLSSRENKNVWEKNTAIYLLYHSGGTPFGGWRHHLSSAKAGALWVLGISGSRCLWKLRRENRTTGLRPWKCTPSAACGGVSPGGGDSSSAIFCATYETGR